MSARRLAVGLLAVGEPARARRPDDRRLERVVRAAVRTAR